MNPETHREERCRCGHLLALLDIEGIEMKCKRCKRLHRITLRDLSGFIKDRGPRESGSNLTLAAPCRCLK
ncbi:MAG: hypothetical protein HY610_00285 [Elusimicrobia bacterium]|nr:hypothetical protein [Elusimicrobiota bacterium]